MKRIFSTMALMLTILVGTYAQDTWTIAGAVYTPNSNSSPDANSNLTLQLFGSPSGWEANNTDNDMILFGGTKYYLIKEITLENTPDAMVEFKVCKNHGWSESHPYGNLNGGDNFHHGNDDNAWVYLTGPSSGTKTFTLIFTFDSNDTGSLDVVQMAKVVEDNDDSTPNDETSWATYLGTNGMEVDNSGTFYFSNDYSISTNNTNKSFKALTIHRSATYRDKSKTNNNVQKTVDNVNGTATTSPNYYVNFPTAGNYQVDFEYNILSGEFNVTRRRYYDKTITQAGDGRGTVGLSTGYASFSLDFNAEVPDMVRAYYITGLANEKMVSVETNFVPAAVYESNNYPTTGVILQGEVNVPYRFLEYLGSEDITLTNNKLCGTGSQTITVTGMTSLVWNNYLVFSYKDGKFAFWNTSNGTTAQNTFPKYKAFYYDGSVHAREYYTPDFMDDTTAIENLLLDSLEESASDAPYYTLQGIRVEHPTHGIYIRNGKKVAIK